ncbi:MAG: hypothetical protein NTZ25_01085 [Candidatus Peregrinibacteria bacterium]|nr:hypothetical protein [Candidatus Peregrinibacteria bacterium]
MGGTPEVRQPEAPKPDAKAAPKANQEKPVVAAGTEARGQKADEIAKGTVSKAPEAPKPEVTKPGETPEPAGTPMPPEAPKPAEAAKAPEATYANPEDLPRNQWTESYYALLAQMKANSSLNGPMTLFALAALRLAAKYSKYMDMIPGSFEKDIDSSTVTIDKDKAEKLADEHLKFLKKTKEEKEKAEADTKKALMDLDASEKAAGRTLGAEKASTKFVAKMLWNNDEFEDTSTLSASLINTTKFGVSLYKKETMDDLVKQSSIEGGTLLIFIPHPTTADKAVAYATGVADEFKYYDSTDSANPVKTFKLSDQDSILHKVGVQTLMILAPQVQAFKDSKEVLSPEDIEKKTQEALDKTSTDNATIAKDIEENKKNPNEEKSKSLKAQALATFTEADDLFKKMTTEANKDELNVAKLGEAEAAAKTISEAPGATPQDKAKYDEAVKKTTAARKFQANLQQLEKIRNDAKKNCDDVGVDTKPTPTAPAVQPATAPGVQASVPKVEQAPAAQAPAAEPSKESKAAWETLKGLADSVMNIFKKK